MTCNPSPFPLAVLAEATRISPHRRGSPYASALGVPSSDGICGDVAHQARNSDHNPDARGIPHAVDISQSTPGAPYWDPRCGAFDAHGYGWAIAARMKAGLEPRVKYLVSFDGTHDVIFDPAVSMTWRENGTGTEHASHLHVSFTDAAEQSTDAFFAPAAGGVHPAPSPQPGGSNVFIATNPNGDGYILVDPQGHVFAFGVAYHGGHGATMKDGKVVAPGTPGASTMNVVGPVTGVAMTSTGNGYYILTAGPRLYALGDAKYLGVPKSTAS